MNAVGYIALVAAALAALGVLMGGAGLLLRRAFGLQVRSAADLLLAPWIGLCLAALILQFWHLFFPVDGRAFLLVAVVGGAGLLWNAGDIRQCVNRWNRKSWLVVLLLLLGAAWVAGQTTAQPKHPDSPLYHIMSVRWATDYPIVPGLGNLRNILAYNSTYFLYAAMLDIGPFKGKFHHLASGWLLFLLLARSAHAARRLLFGGRLPPWLVFDALFLVPVVAMAMGVYGSSPTPDVGVFAIGVVAASELLRLCVEAASLRATSDPAGGEDRERNYTLFALTFLAALGITVKLSFAVTALAVGGLALFAFAMARRGSSLPDRRTTAWIVAAGLLMLGVWMVRGVIASGYPAYPSTCFGWPVEWRLSAESARRNSESVCAWARMPGVPAEQVLGNWRWVWPWAKRMLGNGYTVVLPLGLAAVLAPMLAAMARRTVPRAPAWPWFFLVVPIASLVFWFVTAPEPRFAGASFWTLAIGAIALSLRGGDDLRRRIAVACIVASLFFSNIDLREFLRPSNMDKGPLKKGAMEAMTTRSGLTVYVPVKNGECWDAPLPATTGRAFFDPDLRLRVPGDLSRGFVIDRKRSP